LDREELRVLLNLLPIKLNVDQDAVEFFIEFFGGLSLGHNQDRDQDQDVKEKPSGPPRHQQNVASSPGRQSCIPAVTPRPRDFTTLKINTFDDSREAPSSTGRTASLKSLDRRASLHSFDQREDDNERKMELKSDVSHFSGSSHRSLGDGRESKQRRPSVAVDDDRHKALPPLPPPSFARDSFPGVCFVYTSVVSTLI
jgi:hypothetical protein